jgi:hypothetical protein
MNGLFGLKQALGVSSACANNPAAFCGMQYEAFEIQGRQACGEGHQKLGEGARLYMSMRNYK